jgi:hypothetical protein
MYAPGAMNATDWASVSSLLPLEKHNWGDRNQIDRRVIRCVDDLARTLSQKVLITSGCFGAHSQGSYHYANGEQLGLALDIMFPQVKRTQLPDILFEILRHPFTGIGIYSEWKLDRGGPSIGGFHVDFRPVTRRALWLKGTGAYESLTMAAIAHYFRE